MLIVVIFNTKFRCMLIAINFKTKNLVSVLYAKYDDYGELIGPDLFNYHGAINTPSDCCGCNQIIRGTATVRPDHNYVLLKRATRLHNDIHNAEFCYSI